MNIFPANDPQPGYLLQERRNTGPCQKLFFEPMHFQIPEVADSLIQIIDGCSILSLVYCNFKVTLNQEKPNTTNRLG
jgi:hypothetical protein